MNSPTPQDNERAPINADRNLRVQRKSNQFKALLYKTVSYQKRQLFTNICCVSLCPILLIAFCAGMAVLIQSLLVTGDGLQEFIYCSNIPSLTNLSFPIFKISDPGIAKTPRDTELPFGTQDDLYHTNYLRPRIGTALGTSGPPGAIVANLNKPCVYWFGSQYPFNDPVYSADPEIPSATKFAGLDSTYWPQPKGGWISQEFLATSSRYLAQNQLFPWYLLAKSDSVSDEIVGSLVKKEPFGVLGLVNASSGPLPFKPASEALGILDTIESRYYLDLSTADGFNVANIQIQSVPWFEATAGNTSESLDVAIGSAINQVLLDLSSADKTGFNNRNATNEEYTAFLIELTKIIQSMPYGGVYLDKVDFDTLTFNITLSTGTDSRLDKSSTFPLQGLRQILQISQLTNGLLRFSDSSLSTASITQGVRSMPYYSTNQIDYPFASLFGSILFPFGVSFLLPIFSIILVKEKEERILIMMQMNGLKTWTYYLSHYLHFYTLYAVSSILFLVAGTVAKLEMFVKTDPAVFFVVFFVWGHAQVALALFFSSFFSKSRNALVIIFLIVFCGVTISIAFDNLFAGSDLPYALFIWPPFAFYRILSVLNTSSYLSSDTPYTLSRIVPGDEIFAALMFLLVETVLLLLLTFYLSTVIQNEFGVPRPWFWPFKSLYQWVLSIGKPNDQGLPQSSSDNASRSSLKVVSAEESELTLEDSDVKAERERVLGMFEQNNCPLIMKGMRKVYASRGGLGPKIAVKDVTLGVEKGIVFGLLGPNGAGKTTLISILTGLYSASNGVAMIDGFDIQKEREQVYKILGVCPQYDILWDDLTVEEHLLFYARLKGIPGNEEKQSVLQSMNYVSLEPFRNRLTKGLSGGEKRRLSIAIALVGDPSVVFLDEPTTGLDPEVRRLIWNIINQARQDKTVVLTTHSMEEAEVLCQRIGIMAKGTLRCLGPQLRLKQLYGSGFRLSFVSANEVDTLKACSYVESLLPQGWRKMDSFATNVSYEFHPTDGLISKLFEQVERDKSAHGIIDWELSQTTLEEVFVKIISETDANAD